ncbi:DnaB-like helicase N-terminal domain-containing protein [Nocardia sp. NPDC004260]
MTELFHPRTEQAVLGGMLIHHTALEVGATTVTAEDFAAQAHRDIFETVRDMHAAGQTVDPVTVAAALDRRGVLADVGGPAYLVQLTMAAM